MLQLPWLPEWAARRRNCAALARAMAASSRPGTFTAEDFARYREAWSQPGAYRAMVNWYRAALRHAVAADRRASTVPTLVLWGEQDKFILRSIADASLALCDDGRLVLFHGRDALGAARGGGAGERGVDRIHSVTKGCCDATEKD